MKALGVILLLSVIAIAGCTSSVNNNVMIKANETMTKEEGAMNKSLNETMMKSGYSGAVLAGSSSPVIDFNMADYQAVGQDKLVVLYFYANWCPVCRAEVPEMYSAFSELSSDNVIGFRINFNDDQTDGNEVELARTYGVPYQHTKVLLKNGNVILKSSESWSKNRYLFEINKALSAP